MKLAHKGSGKTSLSLSDLISVAALFFSIFTLYWSESRITSAEKKQELKYMKQFFALGNDFALLSFSSVRSQSTNNKLVEDLQLRAKDLEFELKQVGIQLTTEELLQSFSGKSVLYNQDQLLSDLQLKISNTHNLKCFSAFQSGYLIDRLILESNEDIVTTRSSRSTHLNQEDAYYELTEHIKEMSINLNGIQYSASDKIDKTAIIRTRKKIDDTLNQLIFH